MIIQATKAKSKLPITQNNWKERKILEKYPKD
jgi:hypothetical protein